MQDMRQIQQSRMMADRLDPIVQQLEALGQRELAKRYYRRER